MGWWRCLRQRSRPCPLISAIAHSGQLSLLAELTDSSLSFPSRDPGLGSRCPESAISHLLPLTVGCVMGCMWVMADWWCWFLKLSSSVTDTLALAESQRWVWACLLVPVPIVVLQRSRPPSPAPPRCGLARAVPVLGEESFWAGSSSLGISPPLEN